jgi:epoxyqueuosine reductase QueG
MKWVHDGRKCAMGVITNPIGNICQRCTKTCPWNNRNSTPEYFENWDGDIAKLHALADETAHQRRQNNFIEPEELREKWWLPLVLTDSGIVDAPEYKYRISED